MISLILSHYTSITYKVLLLSYFDNRLGLKGSRVKGSNGIWAWISDGSGLEYSNWHPGEPNIPWGDPICATINWTEGGGWDDWNDVGCGDVPSYFVCQKS